MNFANAAIRAHWARRATSHVTAARSHLYLLAGTWDPERDLPEEHRLIITPQEFRSSPNVILVDPRLLRVIDDRTEQLLSLSAREFEVFVAELLERLGYSIDLSPVGRDGGVDIRASRETDIGSELVLVQCKRFNPRKKVGEPTVKQLCTVVDDEKATRGLIVTTSTFTFVALKYIETKRHRVSGADHVKLQEWMRVVRGSGPGR